MRTLASALLGLAALVLATGAFCSAWLAENIVSEDGFTALAQPLGTDADFQRDLAASLAEQISAQAQVPDFLSSYLAPAVTAAVQGVQGLPGYPAAWDETLRLSHAQTFDGGSGDITLDVTPLVQLVVSQAGTQLGVDLPESEPTTIVLAGGSQGQLLPTVQRAADSWPFLAAAAAVAALLSLLAARRRSVTLALLGGGMLLAGALLWLGAAALPDLAARQAYASPVAETFATSCAVQAAAAAQAWTVPLMIGAAVVMVLGLLARAAAGARRR